MPGNKHEFEIQSRAFITNMEQNEIFIPQSLPVYHLVMIEFDNTTNSNPSSPGKKRATPKVMFLPPLTQFTAFFTSICTHTPLSRSANKKRHGSGLELLQNKAYPYIHSFSQALLGTQSPIFWHHRTTHSPV